MTRTISIITATVGAALLFAVPAWGDNWGSDLQTSQAVGYLNPDVADRAASSKQQKATDRLNAREVGLTAKYDAQIASTQYPDWSERAADAAIRNNEIVVDDRFGLHPQTVPSSVPVTSSGREIDLPQVGIGFGVGLLLALSLFVGMRYTRGRQLAH